jgi:hypothetical protein
MAADDLKSAVKGGLRPSGPSDYGPHTLKVQTVLDFLKSGKLLGFAGQLDERFIPVYDLAKAEELACDYGDSDFRWDEDRGSIWGQTSPRNVLEDPEVRQAFNPNLRQLSHNIDQLIDQTIPEELRYHCYDWVYSDLEDTAYGFALFGELDLLGSLIWQAYEEGGWPCGLTGSRPDPESDFDMRGRKVYVYWMR